MVCANVYPVSSGVITLSALVFMKNLTVYAVLGFAVNPPDTRIENAVPAPIAQELASTKTIVNAGGVASLTLAVAVQVPSFGSKMATDGALLETRMAVVGITVMVSPAVRAPVPLVVAPMVSCVGVACVSR